MLFRVLAVLIGLSPLVGAEILFRFLDWGKPTNFEDPFVGFSDIHPLFVLNETTGKYEIPKSRQTHFRPASFQARKPPACYRIFVLGGSTVQGRPYGNETSFTTWLEIALRTSEPQRSWEVVNCGGISYASYRLVPILQEVLRYQPDLIIVCTGHNEFLEDRTYEHIKHASPWLAWPQRQVSQLRTFTLLRAGIHGLMHDEPTQTAKERPLLGPEADATLDWKGGLDQYHRDEGWRRDVIHHFEFSLRRMQKLTQKANVPLWFMTPVSNLDWPPFKSQHRADLSEADQRTFAQLRDRAHQLYRKDVFEALEHLVAARKLDGQHAQIHYEVGQCCLLLGQFREARAALREALEQDICPLRMLQSMRESMKRVANETDTFLVDAHTLFASRSRGKIPGKRWLVDHVHPTIEGHRLLANILADELAQQGVAHPPADWARKREQAYQKHLASLPDIYFASGRRRLRGVMRWARGHATWERDKPATQPRRP